MDTLPMFTSCTKAQNANALVFTMGEVDVYFSYQTPVAFRSPKTGLVVRLNDWGPTTETHLTAIDGGSTLAVAVRVEGLKFQKMLGAATSPPPDPDPIRKALALLLTWAIDGNRVGNPYCKPEVRAALDVIGTDYLADLRDIAGLPSRHRT